MDQFVIQIVFENNMVEFYSFVREDGSGTVRDWNHAAALARNFAVGAEVHEGLPPADSLLLFEIMVGVSGTRRGTSVYKGYDYKRFPGCSNQIAEIGMEIFHEVKRAIKKGRVV